MGADDYALVAKRLGIPSFRIPDLRALGGAPAPVVPPQGAPPPPTPSYEGASLQQFLPGAPPVSAGPPVPRPSYEGASLIAPPTPGIGLANPPPGASSAPTFRMATGDNLSSAPAPVKPGVMAQINKVADNSERATKQVKASVQDNENAKNLEGATFADGGNGLAPSPYGGSGTPTLVDKGGRKEASWQVTEGIKPSDEASAAIQNVDSGNRIAADLDYESGQKAAEYERGYLDRLNKAAEQDLSERKQREQKYDNQVEEHMRGLDEIRQQVREFKFDANAGMNPIVARIGQAIAIGLGAFASKSGENHGLEAVKARFDANYKDQEGQLNKLERAGSNEVNFLGQLKAKFGDKEAAKNAFYVANIETAKTELAKQLGDPAVADPRMLAAYTRINAKLDEDLAHRELQFKSVTQDRVVRHDVNAPPRYAGPGVTPEAKHDARYLSEAYEKSGLPAALSQLKDVDRVIDTFGDGSIPGLGTLGSLVPNKLTSERGMAARQAVQSVKNAVGHALFGGALSPTEADKLNSQLDGAGDGASLKRTIQSFRQSLQSRASNIAAGASPDGVTLYEQRGGSVQRGTGSQRQVSLGKPATPTVREPE